MANERRVRYNFQSGTISDNPLTNSATTLNSTNLAGLPAISSSEYAVLVLDPTGVGNGPEVVYVTAHTGSATSATIVRGREGTSGVQHASTITWVHVATAADYEQVVTSAPSGGGLPYDGQRWYDHTNKRLIVSEAGAAVRVAAVTSAGRTGGEWSRSTNLSIVNTVETTVTFTTETTDSDGFLTPTSGSITIPSGLGGIYAYDFQYTLASGPSVGGYCAVTVNGTRRSWSDTASQTSTGANGLLVLSAADVVLFRAYIANGGGDINLTAATLRFYRVSI